MNKNLISNFRNRFYLKNRIIIIVLIFAINSCILLGQRILTIEGTVVNNNLTETWFGINIQRNEPSLLIYQNNSITSVNSDGYMLQAGDENPGVTNNKLDGEEILGNKLTWNGTDMTSLTHGLFTGFNRNAIIKYNYLSKVPMGIIRKSNGMTNSSGGVAYNIVNNSPATAVVVKGMNDVNIYNNTFYSAKTPSETWRGIVDIYENTDIVPKGSAKGTKIFNNIFYTKHQIANINLYSKENLIDFASDYNVFYCEDGDPMFQIAGNKITFAKWQALGYDLHSIIINPHFIDFNKLVPASPLNFGTDLGKAWQYGLSVNATWSKISPDTTIQNGKWQVGAYVYKANTESITSQNKATFHPNTAHALFKLVLQN